jgi:hypothetical protein
MKVKNIILTALSLLLLTGCESPTQTSEIKLRLGMSRDEVKSYYGDPLRIEPAQSEGENWYYHFVSWDKHPTEEAGTREDTAGKTSYVSVGYEFTKNTEERPVHISTNGVVIEPLPEGKVVKN